jgi:uncharacterized protein (DUF2164 family)
VPKVPTLPEADRKQAIAALRQYFAANLEEEIGELKAGLLLDFILSELGASVYNQGLADAQGFFEERPRISLRSCIATNSRRPGRVSG